MVTHTVIIEKDCLPFSIVIRRVLYRYYHLA